jgi:hypothetical protein
MQNTEIIVLSIIIVILFAIFIFGPLVYVYAGDHIPEADRNKFGLLIIKALKKLEDDRELSPEEKGKMAKTIQRTISDMESDGVYFDEKVKEHIVVKSNTICEYSGLPSVDSYNENKG